MSRVPFHQEVKFKMFDISSKPSPVRLPGISQQPVMVPTHCLWHTSLKMFGENDGERAHPRVEMKRSGPTAKGGLATFKDSMS